MVAQQIDSISLSSFPMASKKHGHKTHLAENFVPSELAVLCGRGSKCTKSPGNQRLKQLVHHYLQPYSEAKNKVEKTSIVSAIISSIKQTAPNGAFVKYEEGGWWEVEDAFAREKIGCLFRDCLHTQYRSSTKAKLARKKAVVDPMEQCISMNVSSLPGNNSGMHSSLHSSISINMSSQSFPVLSGSGMGGMRMGNHHSPAEESMFHGYQDNAANPFGNTTTMQQQQQQQMLQQQMQRMQRQQQQQLQLPFHMGLGYTPKGQDSKKDEYSALLGNYLGTQNSRPHREDFIRDCMPTSNNMVSQNYRRMGANGGTMGVGGSGDSSNHASSLLREACNIVGDASVNDLDDDEFPDDISDLFEDADNVDQLQGRNYLSP